MTSIDKLPTGVPGLDTITYGGIPQGRATLITGKSGTCKTVLSLQIACHLAREGVKTLFLSAEEEPDDLVGSGDSLGWGATELCRRGDLRVADLGRPMEGVLVVAGDYDLAGLIHRVEQGARDHGVTAVVLDSATALFAHRPPEEQLRAQFFSLVYALRKLGITAIITAEAPADYGPLTTLGVEDFVCDAVLHLRNVIDGERRRRSIEVHKYRRSPHYKGQYPSTMTTRGLTVFPLDTAGKQKVYGADRYSSGIAGLDEMNHGGWLRDSIVLVRGPAGSGKTTLAGMYARAGAARGERVVYYGFEETKSILLRNFAAVGLPMEELERAGNLRIMCRYPEATSPEDLLVDLRVGLDEFMPSLVVLDSVSSIQHSTSEIGFRQFMVGVAALLREHGRSALMTETINPANAEYPPYMSTIPDVILDLDYGRAPGDLLRTIRVVKMRGSAHDTDERRLVIEKGGLRVEPLARSAKI